MLVVVRYYDYCLFGVATNLVVAFAWVVAVGNSSLYFCWLVGDWFCLLADVWFVFGLVVVLVVFSFCWVLCLFVGFGLLVL